MNVNKIFFCAAKLQDLDKVTNENEAISLSFLKEMTQHTLCIIK